MSQPLRVQQWVFRVVTILPLALRFWGAHFLGSRAGSHSETKDSCLPLHSHHCGLLLKRRLLEGRGLKCDSHREGHNSGYRRVDNLGLPLFSEAPPGSEQYSSQSPPLHFFFFFLIITTGNRFVCWFVFLKRECLGLQQLESSVRESAWTELDKLQSWAPLQAVRGLHSPFDLFHATSHRFPPGSELSYMILRSLSLLHTSSHFTALILCPLHFLTALFPFWFCVRVS